MHSHRRSFSKMGPKPLSVRIYTATEKINLQVNRGRRVKFEIISFHPVLNILHSDWNVLTSSLNKHFRLLDSIDSRSNKSER